MSVIRLHVTAEGETEEAFVNRTLGDHLALFNVFADVRCVLTVERHDKEYRGGLIRYQKAKADILDWMKEDDHPECRFTTMFDLYALPKDFPGYEEKNLPTDPYEKVKILENAMSHDIGDSRFIPYIQLHEFEALILADPQQLDWEFMDHGKAIHNLVSMVGEQNPELINDDWKTAPSKRILKEIPEYDKVTAGPSIVGKIGLPVLRKKCRHFAEWLGILETLAAPHAPF